VAEVRIYNRQLDESARARIEAEMFTTWFTPAGTTPTPTDSLMELYQTLTSPRGPLWATKSDKYRSLPPETLARLAGLREEMERLKSIRPPTVPMAVVVQDGGPKGTRHE